jgi:hypothetical protein
MKPNVSINRNGTITVLGIRGVMIEVRGPAKALLKGKTRTAEVADWWAFKLGDLEISVGLAKGTIEELRKEIREIDKQKPKR